MLSIALFFLFSLFQSLIHKSPFCTIVRRIRKAQQIRPKFSDRHPNLHGFSLADHVRLNQQERIACSIQST